MLRFALSTIASVLAISILWPQWRGAMWLPTERDKVHKMLSMAHTGPDDVVYDLGCGDGRVIITAARRFGARAVGIEIEPLRYLWCQILVRVFGLRSRVRVVFGDFFSQDLSEASVITCYLLQRTNRKLQAKFEVELRPGTRIVSNYFTFPKFRLVAKDKADSLYLYAID